MSYLTDDYLDVSGYYSSHFHHPGPPEARESPAFFKYGSLYFMITSGTTSYFPNKAEYAVAEKIHGPWTVMGDPCLGDIKGTTFDSQISSVFFPECKPHFPIAVSDRWKPENNSEACYVWLPVKVNNNLLSIDWFDEWQVD